MVLIASQSRTTSARGQLVQGHLDSVETASVVQGRALFTLTELRVRHKRRRHVCSITTSRDAAVLGSCSLYEPCNELEHVWQPGRSTLTICLTTDCKSNRCDLYLLSDTPTRICKHFKLQSYNNWMPSDEHQTDKGLHNSPLRDGNPSNPDTR